MKNAKQPPFLRKDVAERVNFIIDHYADGNKKAFATATKINAGTVSRLTSGELSVAKYADKIITAYPVIRKEWLLGDAPGESPFLDVESQSVVRAKLEERIAARENEINILQRHIETLTQQLVFMQKLLRKDE
jgi:hypothetical protein